jgi:hypothetical protein
MTRRYRVLLPLTVHTADNAYNQGDVFEREFSEVEEAANLDSGLLELQPMTYKVVGGSVVFDTPPGETFEKALRIGVEGLLVAGGHIERLDEPAEPDEEKPSKSAKRATKAKG